MDILSRFVLDMHSQISTQTNNRKEAIWPRLCLPCEIKGKIEKKTL